MYKDFEPIKINENICKQVKCKKLDAKYMCQMIQIIIKKAPNHGKNAKSIVQST